jgi:hypothetical protein
MPIHYFLESIVKKIALILIAALLMSACAGPRVTRVQPLAESADAPYNRVLVVSLFSSFDLRRYFEQEVVKQLKARGIEAVASTSMMNTKTPVNRDTFVAMVEKLNSDAVVLTQLVDLDTSSKEKTYRAESTYNIRPTYYFNVWSVELTEYVQPAGLELKHQVTLATQVFSVLSKEPVWAIETTSTFTKDINDKRHGSSLPKEASAIINAMARDGLLAK